MDRLKSDTRNVYLRVKIPLERYESLVRLFGSEGRALQHLRLKWERISAGGTPDAGQEPPTSGLGRIL